MSMHAVLVVSTQSLVLSQAQGAAKPSIVSMLMDKVSGQDEKTAQEDIEHYKDVVGVAYVGAQCFNLLHRP